MPQMAVGMHLEEHPLDESTLEGLRATRTVSELSGQDAPGWVAHGIDELVKGSCK